MDTYKNDKELKEKINKCYLTVLKRRSDPSGLNYYFNLIKNGKLTLDELPSAIIISKNIRQSQKKKIPTTITSKIYKPIFIVGVPRSGTTFLYYRLCYHPDLAWLSNLDLEKWISEKEQKNMKKSIMKMQQKNQIIPHTEAKLFVLGPDFEPIKGTSKIPIEANSLWTQFLDSYQKDVDVTKKNLLIRIIANAIEEQKKSRFLNKAPQNSTRLFAIQKCFPDAKFIHLIRDPKAVVSSFIVRAKNEGEFKTGIPIKNKSEYEKLDSVQKWAWMYKEIIEYINEFAMQQSEDNFLSVKYEDLIAHQHKKISEILGFCELKPSKDVMENIPPPRKNQTIKWKNTLNSDDVKKIMEIVSPSLEKINYTVEP